MVPDPYQGVDAKKKTAMAVGGTVAVAALALTGLFASGLLRLGGSAPPNTVRQRGDLGPAITRQTGRTGPALTPQVATRKAMPDDVRDWLNWLAQIEKEKRALTASQTAEMATLKTTLGMGGLGSAADVDNMASPDGTFNNPLIKLREGVEGWKAAWLALDERFRTKAPPAECEPIRDAFSGGLGEIAGSMADINRSFASLDADKGDVRMEATQAQKDARAVGDGHRANVDAGFKRTNQGISEVCTRYDEKPWFDIDEGGAVGGLLSGGL